MSSETDRWRRLARPHPGWCAVSVAIGLSAIGVAAIATVDPNAASRQLRWLIIGLMVLVVCTLPRPQTLGRASLVLCALTLAMLVLLIVPGMPRDLVPVRNGTRAWINLHYMMFQPSELAKVAFVLALARYLRHRENYRTLRGLMAPFAIMFVPVWLILKEPDLGTAVLFFPVLYVMLVAAGARLRHLGMVAALSGGVIVLNIVAILVLPPSMQLLRKHQQNRIKALFILNEPDTRFSQEIGYQQDQSMSLIGSGRVWGYGTTRSAEILRFNHLPEDHNDMIFAVIVNRWGLIGGMAVLGLYLVLIGSFLASAVSSKDPFARLSIVGFAALLFTQITINIGMALGLLPIIGITLPLVSYGGSSLAATLSTVGLVLNFTTARPAIIARPCFEFDRVDPRMGESVSR